MKSHFIVNEILSVTLDTAASFCYQAYLFLDTTSLSLPRIRIDFFP